MMDQAEGLRNVIKYQNQHNVQSPRIFTITSGKGGVGKSNLAVNLAVNFIRNGRRVIIFDADFGLANVEVMLRTAPKYTLSDVIYGNKSIEEIITRGPSDIGFISGGSGIIGLNNLNDDQIRYLVRSLRQLNGLCDVLIVDTGAGISNHVLDFVLASPEVIMVSTPEPSSITDSYSVLKAAFTSQDFNRDETKIHLVANRVTSEAEGEAVFNRLSTVTERFLGGSIDYLGMIPRDPQLERAVRSQKIVSIESPNSKSAKAFEKIAEDLISVSQNETHSFGISRFFQSFLRKA